MPPIMAPYIDALRPLARRWLGWTIANLSIPGLLLATLFFAASLTPSLVPRTMVMQGVLSGVSAAAGYGLAVCGRWLWSYLHLPHPGPRTHRPLVLSAATLCALIALYFLWQAAQWQNSVRLLMELEPVETAHPFRVGLIALAVFTLLLLVGKLFQLTFRIIQARLDRFVPTRLANVVGGLAALLVFWAIIDGVLIRYTLRAADSSFQQMDARMEAEFDQPTDPLKSGSEASLITWQDLGRTGRDFVASGPSSEEIGAFVAGDAQEPIRVYVGLNSADSITERAERALEELKRVDAFERSALILGTPTGTGWMDWKAIDPVEYLHRGDIATVAVQYSYLPSWLSLLAEAEYGSETARALFHEVYGYWTELPADERPELYLYGLSLGALNSMRSADLYDIIGDPFSGALWSGPPYRSETWRDLTQQRQPDSPAWLPRFRDGSIVRFTNQDNHLDLPGAEWGATRIVYLQYASDPITFFEPEIFYREPDWMRPPRGPDVSPDLRWYPVVTMLQLVVDMGAADEAPAGYGHRYAPEHYIDGWFAVTDPPGWSEADVERLKRLDWDERRTKSRRPAPDGD